MDVERALYRSAAGYWANELVLPVKLVVPQPLVARVPGLKTNEEIRVGVVLQQVRGRLLDVGCGTNRLARAYRRQGGQAVGVDVHPWDGVDQIVENTAGLPFPDASFDTVTFVASFNHIPNRVDVLAEAVACSRRAGGCCSPTSGPSSRASGICGPSGTMTSTSAA